MAPRSSGALPGAVWSLSWILLGTRQPCSNFSGGVDGANPQSGLVEDAAGNLYGTTYNGGY